MSKTSDTEAELGQLRAEIDRFDGWILALLRRRNTCPAHGILGKGLRPASAPPLPNQETNA